MSRAIYSFISLVLIGCSGVAPESPGALGRRPFKELCANLQGYSPWLRKHFIVELSKGLMSKSEADWQREEMSTDS